MGDGEDSGIRGTVANAGSTALETLRNGERRVKSAVAAADALGGVVDALASEETELSNVRRRTGVDGCAMFTMGSSAPVLAWQ